jgi:hypothetical protein
MGSRVRLTRSTRGAVFVEQLIAFLPVLWFGLLVWQLFELAVGDLVLRRAASAAARAAVVVLPDDPAFYGGAATHSHAGERQIDIELAAALVLATNTHFRRRPQITIGGAPTGGIDVGNNASMVDKGLVLGGVLTGNPAVTVTGVQGVTEAAERGSGPHGALTVRVDADFECLAAWVNLVCGGARRRLSATASYPYQGAGYDY